MAFGFRVFLTSFLVFCICEQGFGCGLSDIKISQTRTGKVVEGKPQWNVVVSNNCNCAQAKLLVSCLGFSSVQKVDATKFRQVSKNTCIVNNGASIVQGKPISFTFAFLTPVDLKPLRSQMLCK
ncbi:uncharacterized protein LOC131168307 [Malania oleifera]|uniref:uncharacterized protein LOC131168307 n=1 Tax=Malania oleifera TaxID=397392 RepID=UPI0025AE1F6B|nr:uncharacterized protein LOC131168307 [Malania oleifera]